MTLRVKVKERLGRKFDEEIRFFKGWMSNTRAVGAIIPTSSITARRMAGVVNPASGLPVLELGPGTGVITKAILEAHPKLKGMFGANEGSIIGVLNGAREAKRKLVIIGYDSGKQQKEAIMDGQEAGAITQNPVGIGQCVVNSLAKALKGETLPKTIDTGFYWYDKTNIKDPKVAAVLYD